MYRSFDVYFFYDFLVNLEIIKTKITQMLTDDVTAEQIGECEAFACLVKSNEDIDILVNVFKK